MSVNLFFLSFQISPNTSSGFEQANQPFLTDIERRHLLNFCVVGMTSYLVDRMIFLKFKPLGGGPTGVEFSAELYDLLHSDIARHYPSLAKLSKITIYDVASNILGSFDQSLRKYV
jgi:hypothetical protein